MTRIKKVLNSSVVLAEDEKHKEFILLEKGIGYGRKAGQELDVNFSNCQLFIPITHDKSRQVVDLLSTISQEVLDLTSVVLCTAKDLLNTEFNNTIYFVLADHLNFAIERYQKQMVTTNRLSWEIQNFYAKEYKVALRCLEIINKTMNVQLPDEEAVNLAFHFVNAQATNHSEYDSARYAKLIGDIVHIVQYSLNKEFHKDSIHFLRFVTHVRFFVERFFTDTMLEDNEENFYLQQKQRYILESEVANKIKQYVYENYQKLVSDEEMSFLMIHINRLIRE